MRLKPSAAKVVMTSDQHRSGTDRCYEAYQKIGEGYDVIVNIQGDEPYPSRANPDDQNLLRRHKHANSDIGKAFPFGR